MGTSSIPLICYWDGKISHGLKGITYENAIPKATKVNSEVKYSELIEKIYKLTGIDCQLYDVNIICRYLANGEYIPLPIHNDESIDIMLDMTKDKGINCVELYIEKTYVFLGSQSDVRSNVNDGPFTRLLMEEHESNDLPSFGTSDEFVSLSAPIPQCLVDERRSNVHLTSIREAIEVEDYTCVIEGTDINNDLVDDKTEEDLQKIDATCEVYKETLVPEFTKINQENTAIISQWVPWEKNTVSNNNDQEFYIGQQFNTKEELQAATKLYSLRSHQEYIVVESSPTLLVLKCKQGDNIPWKLRASIPKGCIYFRVKKYIGPHTCVNPVMSRHHKQLDSILIANQIMHVVIVQTTFTPAAIQALISKDLKCDITYKKVWKAKMRANIQV